MAAAALIAVAGVWAARMSMGHRHRAPASDLSFMSSSSVADADDALLQTVSVALSRSVYPYSVIPGGVQSAAEFAAKRESDPVVEEHYRDVSAATLHLEQVSEPRLAYMSYRIDDRVYWTKNKLPLREGETILTDGETTIRGRCGNRVSETPKLPVSNEEPAAAAFDRRLDYPSAMALADVSGNSDDHIAANTGPGALGAWPGSMASGGSPQPQARNDTPSIGGGGGFGGSGGGGLPFVYSQPNDETDRNSTDGSSSTAPGVGSSTPGGAESTPPGGNSGSTPPGGGGGSPAPGAGGGGATTPSGGGGSTPPSGGGSTPPSGGGSTPPSGGGESTPPGGGGSTTPADGNGSTYQGGGPGPDGGNPPMPGDLPGGNMPPPLGGGPGGHVENLGNDSKSVPEPASMLLLAGGTAGYALRRIRARRRRN